MTEHRCIDGKWRPGKTKDCPECQIRKLPPKAKRRNET
jgi:hypothetical protein